MRAERLLSIILLLQSHHRLTASELANRLDVSERTILRDMDALSLADIPVFSERGRNGGWGLVEGYRSNLIGLTDEEISALILSPSRILSDLGLDDAAEAATLKLLANLPQVRRQDADFVRKRIHVDGAPWLSQAETTTHLPELQDALWQDSEIHIIYQKGEGEAVERIVAPLGLVAKGRTWYLIAMIDGDYRTYRVSRILEVSRTGKTINRPQDFDLANYWEASTQQFVATLPRYMVTLHIHKDALRFIRNWRFTRIESIREIAEDWLEVIVNVEEKDYAIACVLGCGGDAIVIEPEELKDAVHEKISNMANLNVSDSQI